MLLPCIATAQVSLTDSLRHLIQQTPPDTNRVILLNNLAWELKQQEVRQARRYLQEALALGLRLRYKKGIGQTYNYRGILEEEQKNYAAATEAYEAALTIGKQREDNKTIASLYSRIGEVFIQQTKYIEALRYFQQALELRQAMQDSHRTGYLYYQLSITHYALHNYSEALAYARRYHEHAQLHRLTEATGRAHQQIGRIKHAVRQWAVALEQYRLALQYYEQLDDDRLIATAYLAIGDIQNEQATFLYQQDDYAKAAPLLDQAIQNAIRASSLHRLLADTSNWAMCRNKLGNIYKNKGTYYEQIGLPKDAQKVRKQALDEWYQSLRLNENIGDTTIMIVAYHGISDVKKAQQRYETALQYTQQYAALAQAIGDQAQEQNAYQDLAEIYAAQESYELAYRYRCQYDELRYKRLDALRTRERVQRDSLLSQSHRLPPLSSSALQHTPVPNGEGQRILRQALWWGIIALLSIIGLLLYNYQLRHKNRRIIAHKNAIIEAEQQRSEDLLRHILPAAVATELKQHGQARARHYPDATILVVNFAAIAEVAEVLSPAQLLAELNECFRTFDAIVERYRIEKIKTVGGTYLGVGGAPTINDKHAVDVVHAALDMRAYLRRRAEERRQQGLIPLQMRIGIHTGAVVAGIVGHQKFTYDLWGSTVEIARQMEMESEVDKINISQATYEVVGAYFRCRHRGTSQHQQQGSTKMYFVE